MLRIHCVWTVFVGLVVFVSGCGGVVNESYTSQHDASSRVARVQVPPLGAQSFDAAAEVEPANTEEYSRIIENEFEVVAANPLSTFSIDVDTAAYSIVRKYLTAGQQPPKHAVRIEEMVNYFNYNYTPPADDRPFAVRVDMATCPWNSKRYLARIGLKGKVESQRRLSNLVFLLDVSGSMKANNKLPLVKSAMEMMLNQLGENDRISIVVYAGASGMALPPTPADQHGKIRDALERLAAGGSTNGGAGIQLAYNTAIENFIPGGINRVILCTDGDFNIGVDSSDELEDLIQQKAKSNVYLSVLGFGSGNYKDNHMETLADKGNGNYAYIDTLREAKKVLVDQINGTLVTIAKDVKVQVDFNPAHIAGYRLIGYENRMLKNKDFKDDAKDAGEIGAGHTVTALYELIPVGGDVPITADPSKYTTAVDPTQAGVSDAEIDPEMLTVRLRYKEPEGDASTEFRVPVPFDLKPFDQLPGDFQFASAVASFGMLLRDSKYSGTSSFEKVLEIATRAKGHDSSGLRSEFIELVRKASSLNDRQGGRQTAMTH